MGAAAFAGFFAGLGLIAAIGAQNAFVLRQGVRREHVGVVVLICATSDALLVSIGVGGAEWLATSWPAFQALMLWGGVAFLGVYGALRFRAAVQGGASLRPLEGPSVPLGRVVVMALAFTWLNPHVWLDTVALLGALSAQYAPFHWGFGAGAVVASFTFFLALGYVAQFLAPVLANPRAWAIFEALIGCIMWTIAGALALRALGV